MSPDSPRGPRDAPPSRPGATPTDDAPSVRTAPGTGWAPVDVEPMREALRVAEEATTSGDVPVGAVVLDPQGQVVGVGANRREADHDPAAHAEIVAMRAAAARSGSWRLDGCTLVVTLEPCLMCAGALIQSRVARLVFGAWDDKAGACGSVWDLPRDRRVLHAVEVVPGVLAVDAARLLADFFAARRLG